MIERHFCAAIDEFGQNLWKNGVHRVGLSIDGLANVLLQVRVYWDVGIASVHVEVLQCGEGENIGLGVVFGYHI